MCGKKCAKFGALVSAASVSLYNANKTPRTCSEEYAIMHICFEAAKG